MRLALTKYGWPQVAIVPISIILAMIGVAVAPLIWLVITVKVLLALAFSRIIWAIIILEVIWAFITVPSTLALIIFEVILTFFLIISLLFFRDPYRAVPADTDVLLAPADGGVTDIEIVKENDFIGEHAIRIGIFLSIFDVHINRAPCNAKVTRISYKKGRYKNAASPESGRVNESNDLYIIRTDSPKDRLIVRQVSGAIARRIVCAAKEGQELSGGEKFGMIKFGSRTELYVPARANIKCLVQTGDKVKAGLTPLVRYEKEYQNVNIKMQN